MRPQGPQDKDEEGAGGKSLVKTVGSPSWKEKRWPSPKPARLTHAQPHGSEDRQGGLSTWSVARSGFLLELIQRLLVHCWRLDVGIFFGRRIIDVHWFNDQINNIYVLRHWAHLMLWMEIDMLCKLFKKVGPTTSSLYSFIGRKITQWQSASTCTLKRQVNRRTQT